MSDAEAAGLISVEVSKTLGLPAAGLNPENAEVWFNSVFV